MRFGRTNWVSNPVFDVTFLIGFPLALLILPLTYYLYRNIINFGKYEYALTNFPHVLSGLLVAYLVQKEYKKKPVLLLAIPTVLFISTIIFYSRYAFHIEFLRFFVGKFHIFGQCFYILLIFKLLNDDSLKIDKIIDTSVLVVGILPLRGLSFL